MIKCISLVIAAILLISVSQQAQADSLVCEYRGQFLTYTEVNETKDGVKSIWKNESGSTVIFHNGKEYRYGSIIPCVMIKEDRGKTKFLEEYQSQFE